MSDEGQITAINVLLEPDATMVEHAVANNTRLLAAFPHGFALDDRHHPHVTVLQRFILAADLPAVCAAAGAVFAGTDVRSIRLEAFRYYYIPSGPVGLAGIVAKPNAALVELQRLIIEAVAPFAVPTGDSDAFVTTPDDPVIDPMLIDYVSAFVPTSTGDHYNAHVTTGIATREYLDAMLAEPFDAFEFSPAGAAIYQLGQYGTAAKRLHDWAPLT